MKKYFKIKNDIKIAKTLSSDFYTKKNIFELSKETIFIDSWQLITHKSTLSNKTQYPFSFLSDFIDERKKLASFLSKEKVILIGYNSNNYDIPITSYVAKYGYKQAFYFVYKRYNLSFKK